MDDMQRSAVVVAEAVHALGTIAAMQADNRIKELRNEYPVYTGEDFNNAVNNLRGDLVNYFLRGNTDTLGV